MSRTFHKLKAEKRGDKDYWKSRLHCHGECTGRITKIWTHRKERRLAKREERECLRVAI